VVVEQVDHELRREGKQEQQMQRVCEAAQKPLNLSFSILS